MQGGHPFDEMDFRTACAVEACRIRILDAAAKCFMRYGYESTSIDDVATEMGSTKGLVYYSFKSKAELFFAVYERSIENALLHLQPIADGEDAGLEKLSAVCEKHIILLMATLPYHVVTRLGVEMHTSRAMTPPQHRKLLELINLRDRYEHLFVSLIDAGIRDGSIRNVNVSLAAKTVLGAINSVSMCDIVLKAHSVQLGSHRELAQTEPNFRSSSHLRACSCT